MKEACPHCGHKLSPWQQVLLSVDRALTCKNCWYRILLNVFENDKPKEDLNNDKDQ
jgi:DNA-directed RNA polymerase subunit RPC12/RpoP